MDKKYIALVIAVLFIAAVAYPVFGQAAGAINKYWNTQRVIIHATGTAVTSDMSDYHFVKIHGRLVKVVPIDTANQIKSGTVDCAGAACVTQYGVAKVFAVLQVGTQSYKAVGTINENIFEGTIYTTDYNLRCLAGDTCTATAVGTLKYTITDNYEGYGHAAVGEIVFTDGTYAGKNYISVVKGVKRASEVTIADNS
jgi:hypothetical protein